MRRKKRKVKREIIYRHPLGRFVVIEKTGVTVFGEKYAVREAVLTPERDRRGLLHDADRKAPVIAAQQADEPKKPRCRPFSTVTDSEKADIAQMFRDGMNMKAISAEMNLCRTTVADYLVRIGLHTREKQVYKNKTIGRRAGEVG